MTYLLKGIGRLEVGCGDGGAGGGGGEMLW